jgi:hypothetical protein
MLRDGNGKVMQEWKWRKLDDDFFISTHVKSGVSFHVKKSPCSDDVWFASIVKEGQCKSSGGAKRVCYEWAKKLGLAI